MPKNIDAVNSADKNEQRIKINRYADTKSKTNQSADAQSEDTNSNSHSDSSHAKKNTSTQIDFLKEYNSSDKTLSMPSKGKRVFRLALLIVMLTVFLISSLLFSNFLLAQQSGDSLSSSLSKLNLWHQLSSLVKDEPIPEPRDRINFLLLGMGGAGHDGPYLTDTIIFASHKPSTQQTAMLSIPRDLIVKYTDNYYPKINSVYTIGLQNNDVDSPSAFAADIIGQNLGQQVDYYLTVDFSGFEKVIDILGGVNINVPVSFTDYQYPAPEHKYQTISFEAGPQMMDGDTALKYARSRHGNNGQGSDFARSKRQQQLLFAIKDKILSYNTIFNPYKVARLYNLVDQYVETNITVKSAVQLYEQLKDINADKVRQYNWDDAPDGMLTADINQDGAYILVPKNGYQSLQRFVNNIFINNQATDEQAAIEVHNGTTEPGLAYNTAQLLKRNQLTVINYQNAATQDYQRTIIYDLTADANPLTIQKLQQLFPDALVSQNIPAHLQPQADTPQTSKTDVIIILGQDQVYNNQLNQINGQ